MDDCYTIIYQVDTLNTSHHETFILGDLMVPGDKEMSKYLDKLEYEVPPMVLDRLYARIENSH